MKPEQKSQLLLGVTRSKAKMIEYGVPEEYHIKIPQDPAKLFPLSIGILGDIGARSNRNDTSPEDLAEFRKDLSQFNSRDSNKKTIKSKLRRRSSVVRASLEKYPAYFTSEILDGLVTLKH